MASVARAYEATQKALSLIDDASDGEAALIRALEARYPSAEPAPDMDTWNDDYAVEMCKVFKVLQDDIDVVA